MNFATLLKLPSAYVPVAMSMAALTVVLGAVVMLSPGGESDEGAAAHIFQLLLVGQVPIVAFFVLRWMRRSFKPAVQVVLLQVGAALMALIPVFVFHL